MAGVDTSGASGIKNYSVIAWLDSDKQTFLLDAYSPTPTTPLPSSPNNSAIGFIGFDSPQGLSSQGKIIRDCDKNAKTSTSKIPSSRGLLSKTTLYKGLIEVGIDIFWNCHSNQIANIYGLNQSKFDQEKPTIFETYPRYVIRKWLSNRLNNMKFYILFKDHITHKRAYPSRYVDYVWEGLKFLGYTCPGVHRPSIDQLDAMLCAVVAQHLSTASNFQLTNSVGLKPIINNKDKVFHEGFIVCP
ncbi:DUF429 domain-containing protein [Paenibacillus sp. WLX2291]|uniref:DUF429 domain-containing protein n=1 Tax=Paenibacillus sp. WLX2291 TaxID=3296934 RepID=UPI00398441EB